ncbi:MAG: O-antigen ligase domain-containing protein, partial [Cyclobacteriaceae bacterium]
SEFLSKYADFYRGEHHIHNVFFTNYLQMGLVGLLSYVLFLVYFVRDCFKEVSNNLFWILAFLPLLSIMIILYSGYDNDIVLYLILIFLLGSHRHIKFKSLKTSIL